MQQSDSHASETSTLDDSAPVELTEGDVRTGMAGTDTGARRGLSDGFKATLYVLFGIFLATFIIGIWPLIEILRSDPTIG